MKDVFQDSLSAKLAPMRLTWALLAIGFSVTASAFGDSDPTLTGRWSAGVMHSAWTQSSWGDSCGPSPIGGSDAGGIVTVTQNGSELTISGLGRSFSSNACWEQQPGVATVSHSVGHRQWTTVCRSAATDPRRTTITTNLVASDTTLDLDEIGRYEVAVAGQDCSASVRRTRHFALVEREGEIAPASSATGKPASTCAQPGPAARLEASPLYKLLRPGEQFSFHAKVFDEHGCPLAQKVSWRLLKSLANVDIDQTGVLSVRGDAAEGEVQISAAVGEQSIQLNVYVVSARRYAELLTSPSFNDAGESEASAVKTLVSNFVGTRAPRIDPVARRRRTVFVWAVTVLAVLLGIGAMFLARRRRLWMSTPPGPVPRPPTTAYSASEVAPRQPVTLICPVCGTQYGPERQFCDKDGASLVPIN